MPGIRSGTRKIHNMPKRRVHGFITGFMVVSGLKWLQRKMKKMNGLYCLSGQLEFLRK